jgi:hypothetical protein
MFSMHPVEGVQPMNPVGRNRGLCPPATALFVSMLASAVAVPGWAQEMNTGSTASARAGGAQEQILSAPAADAAADLQVTVRDAAGPAGLPLPLDIKLVRTRNVYVEAVKILGLPRGVVISDETHAFSSASDNNDVDVSAWDLSRIQIKQTDLRAASFALAVAAIWTPESGGHIDVTSSRLTVSFAAEARDRAPSGRDEPGARIRETGSLSPASVRPGASSPPATPPAEAAATEARSESPGSAAAPRPDPLVDRAKGLIQRGDISGARLLLERARARHAPEATRLLAQTWDPEKLRAWKVRGLQANPDLARSLYAQAAEQDQTDGRLAATGR